MRLRGGFGRGEGWDGGGVLAVDDDVAGEFVAADVVDEDDFCATGAGVVEIAVVAAEVFGELLFENGGGDAAAGVAFGVGTEEDEGFGLDGGDCDWGGEGGEGGNRGGGRGGEL